jgi:hypothetical protein
VIASSADEIIATMRANAIGLVQIDPFVSCHSVPENDNGAIDAVTKEWARIGAEADAAIGLTHHVRKMSQGQAELTADDARGAGAMMNAARVGRVLNPMSEAHAKEAKVEDRRRYFRADNAKSNLAPPADAMWFQLIPVTIANGDSVGIVGPWSFPGPFDHVTVADMHQVRDLVQSGSYRADPRAKDWIGHAVADVLGLDVTAERKRLKKILAAWFKNGVLAIEPREDAHRKSRPFVVLGDWNETDDRVAPV